MAAVRAHVFIAGYVQGVFFRHTLARRAAQIGVSGWVRNLPDGRVEAVLEGEEPDVRVLVEWCRRGPPHATVESVEVFWGPPEGGSSGFSVL